jgi:hypothetical protein
MVLAETHSRRQSRPSPGDWCREAELARSGETGARFGEQREDQVRIEQKPLTAKGMVVTGGERVPGLCRKALAMRSGMRLLGWMRQCPIRRLKTRRPCRQR